VHMQASRTYPILDRIFHPSDFSQMSEVAFAHALKLALIARGALHIMHVAADAEDMHWSDFPGVRATLERWGMLPEGSEREAVAQLGLNVEKIMAPHAHPVSALLHYLEAHPTDLIVLATHQRDGIARWMHRGIAEPVARHAGTMTLFIPPDVAGFIALADGAVTLQRILIPIAPVPRPQAAVDVAAGLARTLSCYRVAFTLVYVGASEDMPEVHEPHQEGWTWERTVRHGGVVEQILDVGTACAADLIVLTTEGHHGVLDALRGSTSERILRSARCPVLAIPAS
jgi:nucleotide-binding universal stress UspA family protein